MNFPRAAFGYQRFVGLGLAVAALALTGGAAWLWSARANVDAVAVAAPVAADARAWILLQRSLRADDQMPVAARVQTVMFVGERALQSDAQLWRAPGQLSVTYLSGPMRGQKSGYSKLWFWRSEGGQLTPYAQVAQTPAQVARRRFALMRQNYDARMQPGDTLNGRAVEIIELRPRRPLQGVPGPARRVFVDAQTGLTLRTEAFNARLQPVSHSTLSQIEWKPQFAAATFREPSEIAAVAKRSFWQGEELGQNPALVAREVGFEPPQSPDLPRGFALEGFGVHRCLHNEPGAMQIAAFTRYTDGLNVLTLFAVKANRMPAPFSAALAAQNAGAQPNMSCNFGPATLVSRADHSGTLIAIGDLPVTLLRRTLQGARFRLATSEK